MMRIRGAGTRWQDGVTEATPVTRPDGVDPRDCLRVPASFARQPPTTPRSDQAAEDWAFETGTLGVMA